MERPRFSREPETAQDRADRFRQHVESCKLSIEAINEALSEIEEILFKLVEMGDLDPQVKKYLRAQLKILLQKLGLVDLEDLPAVYSFLSDEAKKRVKPEWYPDSSLFRDILWEVRNEERESNSDVPSRVSASDVAEFAVVDEDISGRGGLSLSEYLYNLGIFMFNKHAYETTFDHADDIEVGENWKIEGGRHRSLVLRVFGRRNVDRSGIGEWVKVKKSNARSRNYRRI